MQFSWFPGWAICSFSKTKWQMPDKCPKGDVHAWNWLSHTSVPCFCALVANQTNPPIKFGSSCRSWENTLNQAYYGDWYTSKENNHSLKFWSGNFFLNYVNALFLSGHNTASKIATFVWLEIQSTLLSHFPTKYFVRPRVVTRNSCLPVPRSIHWIYIKKGIKAFVYHSHRLH